MADRPTDWIVARIRINVSKNDGAGSTPFGWIWRRLTIPTQPAMPDFVDLEVIKGRILAVKPRPLTWDAAKQEYRVGEMTIVLTSPEIARLQTEEPTDFHTNQP
jgi:hypothetical protein